MGAKEEAFRLANQGLSFIQIRKNTDAINCFLQAIGLGLVGNDGIYNNLGIAYSREYFFGKAIRSFSKALSLNPANEQVRRNLVEAQENLQRLRDSYENISRATVGRELEEDGISFETPDGRTIRRTMSEIEAQD